MSEIDIKIIGQRLRAIRKDLGMTQTDVAKKLNVAQSLVSKIELGQAVLSPVMIGYLTLFSDRINLNYLMGDNFDMMDKDALYDISFSLNSIARAKVETLQQDINNELNSIKQLL